jgi:predicted cupin superfamily sugar epimerase
MSIDQLISRLNLEPLAGEGGMWAPIYRDEASNAIYFAMIAPDFSAWHRLAEPELWIHVDGSPIDLYTIEDGVMKRVQLDRERANFSYRVPAGSWMAAKPSADWSLAICSLTPAFTGMELAGRRQLNELFPNISDIPGLFHE